MSDRYKGYRLPKSIIGYAVRLYFRYKLSLRDVSEILIERGIDVTYESIRLWVKNLGPLYAQAMRKKRGYSFTDKWHIDEVRVKIKGEVFWASSSCLLRRKGERWMLAFYIERGHDETISSNIERDSCNFCLYS